MIDSIVAINRSSILETDTNFYESINRLKVYHISRKGTKLSINLCIEISMSSLRSKNYVTTRVRSDTHRPERLRMSGKDDC